MAKRKSTAKKRAASRSKVSKEERGKAREHADQELLAIGAPGLYWEHNGRFCYVYHEGAPLGRLGYKGDLQEWDFAIYKFSTGKYSSTVFAIPCRGTIRDCVTSAMGAYNLL